MSRTRRAAPGEGPLKDRDAAKHLDQDQRTESFHRVGAPSTMAAFPAVLALSATGRIAARYARLEHLHQWAAFEEEEIFPTAEKVALVEAVAPHMGLTTTLADAIAAAGRP